MTLVMHVLLAKNKQNIQQIQQKQQQQHNKEGSGRVKEVMVVVKETASHVGQP